MKWKPVLIAILLLLLAMVPMLGLQEASAAAASKPLPVGSWWTLKGSYRQAASGTGSDEGTYTETGDFTTKFSVTNKGSDTITLMRQVNGQWSCTATGKAWRCSKPGVMQTYSSTYEYTIDLNTLTVISVGKDSSKNLIGHPTYYMVNLGQLIEGGKVPQLWFVPDSDGKGSRASDVDFSVGSETANIKGVQTNVWRLSYSGDDLGSYKNGDGVYSSGTTTKTSLFDLAYGILVGLRFESTLNGNEVGNAGTWTEDYSEESRLEDTSLSFTAPVTLNVQPGAGVAVTVDGTKYSADQLPRRFDWGVGTTHTLEVEPTVKGATGVQYVFVQWSDGSKDASRTLTATEEASLTVTFKTQYELTVTSEFGDPQGAGWYDAESKATASVDSPVPETGLLGSLGGKRVFQEWSGDLISDSRIATIEMDGPKTVEAKWTTDYSQAYVILGGIAAAVIVIIAAALLLSRRKGQPRLQVMQPMRPAAPPIRAPPPVARPPPPTAYRPSPPAEAGVKLCVHCGATIPSVVVYCTKCGRRQ